MGKNLVSHVSLLRTGPINLVTACTAAKSQQKWRKRACSQSQSSAYYFCHKSVTQQPITEKKRWRFLLPARPTTNIASFLHSYMNAFISSILSSLCVHSMPVEMRSDQIQPVLQICVQDPAHQTHVFMFQQVGCLLKTSLNWLKLRSFGQFSALQAGWNIKPAENLGSNVLVYMNECNM